MTLTDEFFRDASAIHRRAMQSLFQRLDSVFYDPTARIYRPTQGDTSSSVTFTPRRFGILQGALRDTYELIALLPGNGALMGLIEDRVARLDNLSAREGCKWPSECCRENRDRWATGQAETQERA